VLPSATLVDYRGVTQTLLANNGVFSLTLDAATANTGVGGKYIIGGPPVLLIQEDTEAPQSALQSLPAVTYGSHITFTWDWVDNGSGPWYMEIDRASEPNGPWQNVLGWGETKNGITQTTLTGQTEGVWYFRSRARDNAGNWEVWPSSAEVWTTVNLSSTLSLSITTYIDTNSNNIRDPGELPPTQTTTIALKTAAGNLVTSTTGNQWAFTQTLREGNYLIQIQSSGLLPHTVTLFVPAGPDIMNYHSEYGLKSVAAEVYAPFILRTQ
jgi:hypothetical protein